ncbi:hypothetical protein ACWIGW_35505 [Nocardia brasiliensis]
MSIGTHVSERLRIVRATTAVAAALLMAFIPAAVNPATANAGTDCDLATAQYAAVNTAMEAALVASANAQTTELRYAAVVAVKTLIPLHIQAIMFRQTACGE